MHNYLTTIFYLHSGLTIWFLAITILKTGYEDLLSLLLTFYFQLTSSHFPDYDPIILDIAAWFYFTEILVQVVFQQGMPR